MLPGYEGKYGLSCSLVLLWCVYWKVKSVCVGGCVGDVAWKESVARMLSSFGRVGREQKWSVGRQRCG